jgi:hypothetical protein
MPRTPDETFLVRTKSLSLSCGTDRDPRLSRSCQTIFLFSPFIGDLGGNWLWRLQLSRLWLSVAVVVVFVVYTVCTLCCGEDY